jgi:hypothetical protein
MGWDPQILVIPLTTIDNSCLWSYSHIYVDPENGPSNRHTLLQLKKICETIKWAILIIISSKPHKSSNKSERDKAKISMVQTIFTYGVFQRQISQLKKVTNNGTK